MKRKQLIGSKQTCEDCKNVFTYTGKKGLIQYTEDPYKSEIDDDHTKHWLCDDCYAESQDNI